jgi:exopolysaccharide production protein ExoY
VDLEFVDERPVARAVGTALLRPRLALTSRPQLGRRAAKRAFDLTLTVLALPFALVVMSLAALAILLVDRQRPFYFDRRVGLGGRLFRCVKLRTMRGGTLDAYFEQHPDEAERYRISRKLQQDPRTTRLGSMLRRWSVDELPQLFNVLAGQMSIVGPRPLERSEFLCRGERHCRDLVSVRPGITGLWQVNGRSDVSPRKRAILDRVYARRWSLGLDARILIATPAAVLSRRGAR